jgi:acetoin utilization deacetylase AcuC-like enzyme
MVLKMKIYYNENYTASKYAFDTTRKSKAIVASLDTNPIKGATITDPETDAFTDVDGQVTNSEFSKVAINHLQKLHADTYFEAVLKGDPRDLAESQGFDWDEGIFKMSVAHASGLIAATHEALTNKTTAGSLSSGLHHAHLSHGAGFCTFNGLAAAADYAIESFGAERVLILDFDAHAGGGTWEIVNTYHPDNVVQVDVTCAAFDTWTPEGESSIWYTGHQDYRKDIDRALVYASKKLDKFDLIIYNAGMDPLNSGVSMNDIVYRENAVRDFIGETPAIYALAGGYTWGNKTMDDVVDWHRITLKTWADAQ